MKYSVLLFALLFSLTFSGLIVAQDIPADENEPAKPPVPFKYLEDNPPDDPEPETPGLQKPLIQFIFDGKLEERVEELTNFMKNVDTTYGDKLALRATDINKDEKAKKDWDGLLKEKNIEATDVIVLIVDPVTKRIKFIIGLNNIINGLAGHINFALEPDKYTDPFNKPRSGVMRSDNFSTQPHLGNQPPTPANSPGNSGTIIEKEDEYKGKFEVLISVFIAFFALVVGFFIAWLVLRNKKPAAPAPAQTEVDATEKE